VARGGIVFALDADELVQRGSMKTFDEIKRILVDDLGFRDLASYTKWIKEVRPTIVPTPARVEKLSPDLIDCRDFWRACDELFGSDPVCNVAIAPEVGRLPYPIETPMDANRMNLRLAKTLGITPFLDENAHERVKTLEIGPGRITSTPESTWFQEFPASSRLRDLVDRERGIFSYVVSSNVFQHLSVRQREKYLADAEALLHEGGLLIFNLMVDTGKLPPHTRDRKGTAWADHYGQYTPIPKPGALYDLIAQAYDILYVTQRYDGLFNFTCRKR
jgi:hypothetical protein